MDDRWLTVGALVVMMIVVPIGIALFLGVIEMSRLTPLAFECRRCAGKFKRRPYRKFPAACPLCRARDWNA